ncbi:class I SAM-dependent methyltransferase [Bremerella cremea]|uniref:Class I SAM-dependent methyltransferase n=1 Tax=Bremerella cremea TaxID=1031537 RepID=A0A368KRN9_9BACT|nr:class I SAM-dependent methyltransferase [Bremerella cremea]RCS46449.1 class I SAM-dependent methyltransferase [Bremerella cremea]
MIFQHSESGLPPERAALLAEAIQQGRDAQRFVRPDIKAELADLPYRKEALLLEEPCAESSPPVQLDPLSIEEPKRRSIAKKVLRELQRPFRRLLKRLRSISVLQPGHSEPCPAEQQPDPLEEFRNILRSYEQKIHDLEVNYCSMLASDRLEYRDSITTRSPVFDQHDLSDHAIESLFVHTRLPAPPARVLVLDCAQSKIAIELASLGFDVVGADRQRVSLQHPNLVVIHANGHNLPVAAESFDVVVSLASLSRDQSSENHKHEEAAQIAAEALRVLKHGGKFLLAAPYTTANEATGLALNSSVLQQMTLPFDVKESSYALLEGKFWKVTSDEEAARQNVSPQHVSTLVLLAMQKG